MAPNTVLGSIVGVKYICLGSTVHAVNQYLLIENPIALGPNSKAWGKNTALHSTGNYVGNVLKLGQEFDKSGTQ